MNFELNPTLAKDSVFIINLKLCQVRIMNDANYPWLLLIPRINKITELDQLTLADYQQLMNESRLLSDVLTDLYRPDKLNIATLGNVVPQFAYASYRQVHNGYCVAEASFGVLKI